VVEMEMTGVAMDASTYTALITQCASSGDYVQAETLLDKMLAKGVSPNLNTYVALVTAYTKGGKWEEALEVFDEMLASNMKLSTVAFNSALGACEVGHQWYRALELYGVLKNIPYSQPNLLTCKTVLSTCKMAGKMKEATSVISDLKALENSLKE